MKATRINSPDGYNSGEWTPGDINIDAFIDVGADQLCYWYSYGCYEGAGQAIFHVPNLGWFHHDMGHCSCYGPTDDNNAVTTIPSRAKLNLHDMRLSFSKQSH